jgi:hypothetical protein
MKLIFLLFYLFNCVNSFIYPGHYFGFVPELKGVIKNYNTPVNLSFGCFNNVSISLRNESVNIETSNKQGYLCYDTILVSNHHRMFFKNLFLPGSTKIELHNISNFERNDLNYYGLNIFHVKNGLFGSLIDMYKTSKLFKGDEQEIERENLKFIKGKMNHEYQLWNKSFHIDESNINSGDYFSITRLDGLDPMIMWGTGSFSGHTAIALRINGELYICESTDANPFGKLYWPPPYGIIKTPYKKWLELAEKASYLVVVLRLDNNYQKIFNDNIDLAINFYNDVENLPYGKHNFLFGWIDTEENNYPEDLTHQFITNSAGLLARYNLTKSELDIFITEPINQRLSIILNKEVDYTFEEIIQTTIELNFPISKLLTLPENDNWSYSNGKSLVCNTFVTEMYKSVGIFKEINNNIEATEFTPRDSYMLKIFNSEWNLPGCNNNNNLCQIMGKYEVILPEFNTIKMYEKMNQKCPSLGPKYERPDFC